MKRGILVTVTAVLFVGFCGTTFAGPASITQKPSFPVTISKPGSYILNSNLKVTDPSKTVILVTTDNVTIDLNGFSILGPTVCTGTPLVCNPTGAGNGIDASGMRNIKIYNGVIEGMGNNGIVAGENSIVESMRVTSNGGVGILLDGGTVNQCVANENGNKGICLNNYGTVSGNTANYNGYFGIAASGMVTGNTANNNASVGISVTTGTVSCNTANNNLDGILSVGGLVSNNTTQNNSRYGLNLQGVGYSHNVSNGNTTDDCHGGTTLGNNLCGTTVQ